MYVYIYLKKEIYKIKGKLKNILKIGMQFRGVLFS